MNVKYLKQFRKDVIKLNKSQMLQLKKRLTIFHEQPTHPLLNNHALKGKLKGRFSINITGDVRAIYRIKKNKKIDDIVEFIRLGTHSELY